MATVAKITQYLDRFAPPTLAADWDNVGLLLGDGAAEIQSVMTCLTVTPEVVQEAMAAKVGLIVSHHPILFRPTQRITTQTEEGKILWALAKAGIAVYSPHTAFDNTVGGINDSLAKQFGLLEVGPLKIHEGPQQFKIVVFAPDADLQKVSDGMFAAGAGIIGNYRQCSFRLAGTGTFFGSEAANPTVGQKGQREEVNEWRLEVVCPASSLANVVAALRKAHSYEEPAFDIYPLKPAAHRVGEGRVGRLAQGLSLEAFARQVKEASGGTGVQFQGEPTVEVQRVAIVCGAGGGMLNDVFRAKADVIVTGEMRFHESLSALARGVAIVLMGHYASERPAVEALAIRLQESFGDLKVWASTAEHDPTHWV